jgi:hypothetical protein
MAAGKPSMKPHHSLLHYSKHTDTVFCCWLLSLQGSLEQMVAGKPSMRSRQLLQNCSTYLSHHLGHRSAVPLFPTAAGALGAMAAGKPSMKPPHTCSAAPPPTLFSHCSAAGCCFCRGPGKNGSRQAVNEATSFLDASCLYGDHENVTQAIRAGGIRLRRHLLLRLLLLLLLLLLLNAASLLPDACLAL